MKYSSANVLQGWSLAWNDCLAILKWRKYVLKCSLCELEMSFGHKKSPTYVGLSYIERHLPWLQMFIKNQINWKCEQVKTVNNRFYAAKSTKQGAREGVNPRQWATMRLDWELKSNWTEIKAVQALGQLVSPGWIHYCTYICDLSSSIYF